MGSNFPSVQIILHEWSLVRSGHHMYPISPGSLSVYMQHYCIMRITWSTVASTWSLSLISNLSLITEEIVWDSKQLDSWCHFNVTLPFILFTFRSKWATLQVCRCFKASTVSLMKNATFSSISSSWATR